MTGSGDVDTCDVLVVGAGAAGMYAAIAASRAGADVLLLDKSIVGRGGATAMAQMTVAAAIGHAERDSPEEHLADTLAGGREVADPALAGLMCGEGPERIHETRVMGVRWAADGDRIRQVVAPGHSKRRCCYVDVLATGQSISTALRRELRKAEVRTVDAVAVTDLVRDGDGRVVGAVALDVDHGAVRTFTAGAVVVACGGLTELYARNSAAATMTGDAYALALRAGAELVDMEMVQHFPIAALAPRMIGLDPIMWDPFRYKLGGRLLNGEGEEFVGKYAGVADEGTYTATRDVVSYAILKEVEAGRGTPAGGAYLDFRGIPSAEIHAAFPPVVDKLLAQGIDLTQRPVEVAPMAHYTIGGIRTDADMWTGVPGLFAAGEAVGGAHGANRLSGNAITEAFTFGHRAGVRAAEAARGTGPGVLDAAATDEVGAAGKRVLALPGTNPGSRVFLPAVRRELQDVMQRLVGPFRTEAQLVEAGGELVRLRRERLAAARVGPDAGFNMEWLEWLELDTMLTVAEAVRRSALERRESRGCHQREDHVASDPSYVRRAVVREDGTGALRLEWRQVDRPTAPAASPPASGGGAGVA